MPFRTDLEPGTEEARREGCICDYQGDRAVAPIRVEKHCPIHGLGELLAAMKGEADA